MPEPTYRIAQRLHERRAAKGLETYWRHLDADSQGCMLVHALEEAADQVAYLLAEIQRRQTMLKKLDELIEEMQEEKAPGWAYQLEKLFDLFGGESALAQYDEILGGGTVAENATVDPRDEALRVATEALEKQRRGMENILEFRQLRTAIGEEERFGALTRSEIEEVIQQIDGYIAAIRGAR